MSETELHRELQTQAASLADHMEGVEPATFSAEISSYSVVREDGTATELRLTFKLADTTRPIVIGDYSE